MSTLRTADLVRSLNAAAATYQRDADRLRDLAALITKNDTEGTLSPGFEARVVDDIFTVLNTSNLVGSLRSAIHDAGQVSWDLYQAQQKA